MVLVSAKHNEHIPGDAIRVGVCRNEKSFNIIYLKPATSEPKKKSLQAYKQLCTAADKKAEKIARKVLKKKTNKLLKKKTRRNQKSWIQKKKSKARKQKKNRKSKTRKRKRQMRNQKREDLKESERKIQKKSCRVNDVSIHHLERLNMVLLDN